MQIKLIPETDAEKAKYGGMDEVVHADVHEFLMFGNKIDTDGDLTDFHEWAGQPRYLLGSLQYFYETLNDERKEQREKHMQLRMAQPPPPVQMPSTPINVADVENSPMVKHGQVFQQDLQPIDITGLEQTPLKFPDINQEIIDDERAEDLEEDIVENDVFGEDQFEEQEVNIDIDDLNHQAKTTPFPTDNG